jgi:hypothetical protein
MHGAVYWKKCFDRAQSQSLRNSLLMLVAGLHRKPPEGVAFMLDCFNLHSRFLTYSFALSLRDL